MTETELNRLRKELDDKYRELQKEYAKIEKDAKKEDGLFNADKKRAQALAKQAALKELMEATSNFQKSIEVGSTESIADQKQKFEILKSLEDKYNYKKSNCKYSLNTPILNTLKTHHNRSVKKNVEKPISTFLKKAGLAIIPFALIPLFPVIGLGAIGGALATPLAWIGLGLAGRSVYHAVQGFIRKTIVKQAQIKDKGATYDSLYPTQGETKGFFRTLAYNRMMKKTAGNMYSSLHQMNEYNNFKGAEIAPVRSTGTEEEKGSEDTKGTGKDPVIDFIREVLKSDCTKFEVVEKLNNRLPNVFKKEYVTEDNKDLIELTIDFLKLADALHKKEINDKTTDLLASILKKNSDKSVNYEVLRGKYAAKIKDLCKALGYDSDFMKTYFGEDKEDEIGDKPMDKPGDKPMDKPGEGPRTPPTDPPSDKPMDKPADKPEDKPTYEETFARTPDLMMLVEELRNFDTSRMTMENYNKANRIIAKIDAAYRTRKGDFYLDNDDELTLAEVRSMADAYESKSKLLDKLKVCEASMGANAFYKEAFEDCIKEFYNIVGHTTYTMAEPKKEAVVMTEYGPLRTSTGTERTAVSIASSRHLLTPEDYKRVKKVLEYYKKYSTLTRQSGFADYKIQEEEYSSRRR